MKEGLNHSLTWCVVTLAVVGGLLCVRADSSVTPKTIHSLNTPEDSRLSFESVAGRYSQGDPLVGSALTLTKTGRFEYSRHSCMGGSYQAGIYRLRAGYITLVPQAMARQNQIKKRSQKPEKNQSSLSIPSSPFTISSTRQRFLPIRWGTRLYLLEEKEVLEFCNAINLGDEPFMPGTSAAGSHFLLRVGDEKKGLIGWPVLSEKWQSLLLPAPIYARVLQVTKGNEIIIDAGRKEGLFVGMVWTDNLFNFGNDYKVVAVSPDKAVLRHPYGQIDKAEEAKGKAAAKAAGQKYLPPFPNPAAGAFVGQILSTRRSLFADVQILTDSNTEEVRVLR